MLLLAILLGISVSAVLYDHNGWDFLGGTALGAAPAGIVRMGGLLAPLLVVSVTLMVLVVEGGTMVADTFRRQLQERARQRGREEGREEERARWEEWLARKEVAELQNLPFDEPRPSADWQLPTSDGCRRVPGATPGACAPALAREEERARWRRLARAEAGRRA